MQILRTRINLLALAFCAASSIFWMLFVAQWYYFRMAGGWDTAYFIQTLLGLKSGSISPSLLNASFLIDHCQLLTFLLAPIYWVYPDPMFLQYLKIWAFFGGAYIFFLILKKRFNPWVAFFAMAAFTLAPANVSALRFAFSYEVFAIPLIFLIFKAFDDKRYGLYISCCVLLMMVKEQMPLVVMMFGVLGMLFRREDWIKWGLVPFLMGLGVFITEVFVFLPLMRKLFHVNPMMYWGRYRQFGKSPVEILSFLFLHPGRVFAEVLSPINVKWYNDLFGVWGGFGFLSLPLLLPALPLYLKMVLSSESIEHTVFNVYYACIFTPFVFLAVWNTLNYVQGRWRNTLHALAIGVMFIHAFAFVPMWKAGLVDDPYSGSSLATKKFIDEIPVDAPVLSSRKAMPYLADRKELYSFKDYLLGKYYISGKKFDVSDDIKYALVDFSELRDSRFAYKVTAFNFDNRFELKESVEDVALFVRNISGKPPMYRLIERSSLSFAGVEDNHLLKEDSLSLENVGYFKEITPHRRLFLISMYWKCLKKSEHHYDVDIRITRKGEQVYEKRKPVGSTIYPPYLWKQGEHVKEDYFYFIPHLEVGQYELQIQLIDLMGNHSSKSVSRTFFVKNF